jgi:hypothetical protein
LLERLFPFFKQLLGFSFEHHVFNVQLLIGARAASGVDEEHWVDELQLTVWADGEVTEQGFANILSCDEN